MGRKAAYDEDAVVSRALELFWEKGYEASSTKDLINATGLSNGSLFNAFGDKNALYLECLEAYDKNHIAILTGLFREQLPFHQKIEKILHAATAKSKTGNSYAGCFLFNTTVDLSIEDPNIRALAAQMNKDIADAAVEAVREAVKSGEITSKVDATALAQYLVNIISGLRALLLNNPPASVVNNIITTTLSLLPL